MSDGDETSKRERVQNASRRSGDGEFDRAVSKIAVAQICETVGFQGFRESALEGLTDIAIRFLCDLGRAAGFYANLAGRTQCNVFDVIVGLEDLGSSQGFSGASETNRRPSVSGSVKEIVEYVGAAEEIPFAQPIPRFPVIKDQRAIPSFMQMGETPTGKHIPAWLPALPDPHTYVHTPVWNERATDPRADKVEQARQRRKAERSLLSLQQRLVYNTSAASLDPMEWGDAAKALRAAESNPVLAAAHVASVDPGDNPKEFGAAEGNPYLATPLQPGEKDVSAVVLPAKLANEPVVDNHVSVLEAFAPAIEAVKGGFSDSGDGERKFLPDRRPSVHFKFRNGKKFFGESMDLSFKNKSPGKSTSLIGRLQEKDDKKRRAELILRQSMENPQELTQL